MTDSDAVRVLGQMNTVLSQLDKSFGRTIEMQKNYLALGNKLITTQGHIIKMQETVEKNNAKATKSRGKLNAATRNTNRILIKSREKLNGTAHNTNRILIQMKKMMEGGVGITNLTTEALKAEIEARKELDDSLDSNSKKGKDFSTIWGKMAHHLTSTDTKMATVRKIMYGFFPAGMFRLVNKLAVTFKALDNIFGSGEDDSKKVSFLKMGAKHMKSMAGLGEGKFGGKKGFWQKFDGMTQRRPDKKGYQAEIQRKVDEGADRETAIEQTDKKDFLKSPVEMFFRKTGRGLRSIVGLSLKFLKHSMMFMLSLTLYLILAVLIWKALGPQIIEAFKVVWVLLKWVGGFIWSSISMVWDGLLSIYKGFTKGGSLMDIVDGAMLILGGLLGVLLGLLMGVLGAIVVWFGIVFAETVVRVAEWIDGIKGDWKNHIGGIIKVIGVIVLLIMGWPAMLTAVVGAAVVRLIKHLKPEWYSKAQDKIKDVRKMAGFASGGVSTGGMALVGEEGPEIVNLPMGARVHSNSESKKMVGGSVVNNISINVKGHMGSSDADIKKLAQKLGNLVSKEITRKVSSPASIFR